MGTAIKICISDEPTDGVIHRFQNFGEDVYRSLQGKCSVSLEEVDSATTSFTVRDIRRRDLGDVTLIIKRELKRHNFESSATLTRL